ncbi:MAG TPA: M48 family metallopeptidase [Candidatus Sulfotelmatobacter sp.]|nr:M48 family metallopeptidase [Candidatus Sulfotelmatobacter sp.]
MHFETIVAWGVAGILLARLSVELWLSTLNRRHVLAHADAVPPAFQGFVNKSVYDNSVAYTLAKERFGNVEAVYRTLLLIVFLFSGILPWTFGLFAHGLGQSAWAMAAFLFVIGLVVSALTLPLDWISQFRLEQKFGFNTTTWRTWWSDRLKALLLSVALGYPLLALLLKIVTWAGSWWWLWNWGAVMAVQLLLSVLAPVLILPLFNKLTPLPEGTLRNGLLDLARRTQFRAGNIQLMDGSKRSRHSNAFFTGFGRFRKIVLFDTLIEQLSEPEVEAVVAHEIGHYRKGHIPRMLLLSAVSLLAGFYVLAVLARQEWFYRAFGFGSGNITPAFLIFGLLAGTAGFWIGPLVNRLSRRYEYQADAFAAQAVGQAQSLIAALRKLNGKNLSNLVPHPLYSGFYYSHPTLLERERALGGSART